MKSICKLVPFFVIIVLCFSCEREPEFVHQPPVNLKSWLDYSDSDYCSGEFTLNDSSGPVLIRSNFDVLADTQWSFVIKVPAKSKNNYGRVEFVGFKLMNSQMGIIINEADFISKIVQTSKAQFNSMQTKINAKNFRIVHKSDDLFEINGNIKVYIESPLFALDSFEMSFNNILVEKSYVRVWVNGGIASPFSWEIDLKGGNDFNPEPTITIMPEFGKVIQIGLGMVDGKHKYEISPTEKQFTNFKNRAETWEASSGYFLFDKFYYKDIVKAKFSIKYQSPDKLTTYSVDSVKINYSRISF